MMGSDDGCDSDEVDDEEAREAAAAPTVAAAAAEPKKSVSPLLSGTMLVSDAPPWLVLGGEGLWVTSKLFGDNRAGGYSVPAKGMRRVVAAAAGPLTGAAPGSPAVGGIIGRVRKA